MTDLEAVKAAILLNPDDDAPRLAYAEMIEENDPKRSEFIRLQLELASHGFDPFCPRCRGYNRLRYVPCSYCKSFVDLKERESELLTFNWTQWSRALASDDGYECSNLNLAYSRYRRITFARGFVRDIDVSFKDWLRLGDRVICDSVWAGRLRAGYQWAGEVVRAAEPVQSVGFLDQSLPTLGRVHRRGAVDQVSVLGYLFSRPVRETEWVCDYWPDITFTIWSWQFRT